MRSLQIGKQGCPQSDVDFVVFLMRLIMRPFMRPYPPTAEVGSSRLVDRESWSGLSDFRADFIGFLRFGLVFGESRC
jgi:hypothetical protein